MAKVEATKYIDLISQGVEEQRREEREFANEEAKIEVDRSILDTKKELAKAKRLLLEASKAEPYSLEGEVVAFTIVEQLEKGLALATKIQKARF